MRRHDAYDLQGKPLKAGVLVGFYDGGHERLISGRCLGMSNGKIMIEVPVGQSYTWRTYLWPQACVVLEEPVWPN